MSRLIDFLLEQPLILILLGAALLQWLGSLGQKAARRVAEEQQRQRGGTSSGQRPRNLDEIADEIRRRRMQEQQRRVEPPSPPPAQPAPWEAWEEEPEEEPPPRPTPTPKAAPVRADVVVVETRGEPQQAAWMAVQAAIGGRPARWRRKARPWFDRRNPRAAIVAMAVLGPPRALRSWDDASRGAR